MTKLRSLNIPSLTAEIIKVLELGKIKTVETLLFSSKEKLDQCNIDPQVMSRIVTDVQSYFLGSCSTLSEILETIACQSFSIATPGLAFNSLFGGKICSGQVIELCGSSSTGKTQLCHFLSMIVAQTSGVYYIDTGLSLSTLRLRQMHQHYSLIKVADNISLVEVSEIEMLDRIRCFEIFDAFVLLNLLEQTNAMIESKESYFGKNLRLIVIDSITSLIAPILGGVKMPNLTQYPQRQGHSVMVEISRLIKEIAVNHDVIVLLTNSLIGEEGGDQRPALGASWVSVPSMRLTLAKEKYSNTDRDLYSATVESSNCTALGAKSYFEIQSAGIIEF
jgi:RAD51-like protein 3